MLAQRERDSVQMVRAPLRLADRVSLEGQPDQVLDSVSLVTFRRPGFPRLQMSGHHDECPAELLASHEIALGCREHVGHREHTAALGRDLPAELHTRIGQDHQVLVDVVLHQEWPVRPARRPPRGQGWFSVLVAKDALAVVRGSREQIVDCVDRLVLLDVEHVDVVPERDHRVQDDPRRMAVAPKLSGVCLGNDTVDARKRGFDRGCRSHGRGRLGGRRSHEREDDQACGDRVFDHDGRRRVIFGTTTTPASARR